MPERPLTTCEQAIAEAVACGGDATRLEALVAEAAAVRRDDRLWLRQVLVYPAAVGVLAILGAAWITTRDGVLIHDVQDAFRDPPIPTPRAAWEAFDGVAVSVAVGGLLAAIGLTAWILRLGRRDARSGALAVRCDVLADLAAGDCPVAVGDRLARAIAAEADAAAAPPSALVAHAVARDDVDARASLLRSTAAFYRGLDARRRRALRRAVPTAATCVVGWVVLIYGIALFRPLVGLVDALAAPRDGGAVRGGP
ncbi:MAG: hypothetical protein EBS51_08465 [Planctomycetia bacterium]|nr:hypothetical protein [Planctomycetia bacterium]